MFQKKAGMRWIWNSPNGVTNTEIDYILTNRTDIVTDVTVINQVNTGSDHIVAMSNTKLVTKRLPRVNAKQIGSKKIEFQLELRNRFNILQELDDNDHDIKEPEESPKNAEARPRQT